ncbi:hypothetical protein [Streptomyces sp. NPDC054940]
MDQGDAAVWAAGLGIAGTLLGALGGAWVQARAAHSQVIHQEAADVRTRVRDERRAAFSAILDQIDQVSQAAKEIMECRREQQIQYSDVPQALRSTRENSYRELQRRAMDVEIAGPEDMATLSKSLTLQALHVFLAAEMPSIDVAEMNYNLRTLAVLALRTQFVENARKILEKPDRYEE